MCFPLFLLPICYNCTFQLHLKLAIELSCIRRCNPSQESNKPLGLDLTWFQLGSKTLELHSIDSQEELSLALVNTVQLDHRLLAIWIYIFYKWCQLMETVVYLSLHDVLSSACSFWKMHKTLAISNVYFMSCAIILSGTRTRCLTSL